MAGGKGMAARPSALPETVSDVRDQVNLVQSLLQEVMRKDVHYGTIPGTDKPALLKPGAEKIGMMFRLFPEFEVERIDLDDGHREVQVITTLSTPDGLRVGQGVGTASTMEGKYRYRWENTEQAVPSEYWETRDPALLGGSTYAPRKTWVGKDSERRQVWMIFHRVDHDNPADYYNTILKMAKKRSHVDAILTTTAASDIFDQDVDDPDGVPPAAGSSSGKSAAPEAPPAQPQRQHASGKVTAKQCGLIRARLNSAKLGEDAFLAAFELGTLEELDKGKVDDALSWIEGEAS